MIDGKKVLALIPARGGSKGIKQKNIKKLCGKPLIAYSIIEALKSQYIDRTIVSTDDETIANISRKYGANVPFRRSKELASDDARTIDVILDAVRRMQDDGEKFDILILLQPTSPLRTVEDIDNALERFIAVKAKGVVSVSLVDDHPILIRKVDRDGGLVHVLGMNSSCRRQDMDLFYRVNGCIYINRIDQLNGETSLNDNPVGYIMEKSHSVDIDELKDFALAEFYISQR